MYSKNLTKDFRLRLSETDMTFLQGLAEERDTSISEVIRQIIGEYRRSLDTMATLKSALQLAMKNGGAVHGDTKTDFDDIV